jgi:hypothetical protein
MANESIQLPDIAYGVRQTMADLGIVLPSIMLPTLPRSRTPAPSQTVSQPRTPAPSQAVSQPRTPAPSISEPKAPFGPCPVTLRVNLVDDLIWWDANHRMVVELPASAVAAIVAAASSRLPAVVEV